MYGWATQATTAGLIVFTAKIAIHFRYKHWDNYAYRGHVIRCIQQGIKPLGPKQFTRMVIKIKREYPRMLPKDKVKENFWGDYEK